MEHALRQRRKWESPVVYMDLVRARMHNKIRVYIYLELYATQVSGVSQPRLANLRRKKQTVIFRERSTRKYSETLARLQYTISNTVELGAAFLGHDPWSSPVLIKDQRREFV